MEDGIKKLLAKGPAAGRRSAAAAGAWGSAVPSQFESAELKPISIVREAAQCFNRAGFHGTSLAMFTLLGAINWVPKWYRDEDKWSASEVAESLVDLAVRSTQLNPNAMGWRASRQQ